MRHLIAILLLLTAAVHPLAHFGEEMVVCPCVHGAVAELEGPSLGAMPARELAHAVSVIALVSLEPATMVPARAPPAA